MSRHDEHVRLGHMCSHAQEAVDLCRNRRRGDLDADRMLNLSLVRLVEIVGEAANRVPEKRRQRHPEIPWAQIVGMRNRIVHGYDVVDFDILWEVVKSDLPSLIAKLKTILEQA